MGQKTPIKPAFLRYGHIRQIDLANGISIVYSRFRLDCRLTPSRREDAMPGNYRLKITVGEDVFDAEGPEAAVKEQFAEFRSLVEERAKTQKPGNTPATPEGNGARHAAPPAGDLHSRVFQQSPDGTVSLKVLPKGKDKDADALLLILYGFQKLKGQDNIFGTRMSKAAQISGVSVSRIDKALERHSDYYIRGGQRRSANYTLNNQGITKAEEIMNHIFD